MYKAFIHWFAPRFEYLHHVSGIENITALYYPHSPLHVKPLRVIVGG